MCFRFKGELTPKIGEHPRQHVSVELNTALCNWTGRPKLLSSTLQAASRLVGAASFCSTVCAVGRDSQVLRNLQSMREIRNGVTEADMLLLDVFLCVCVCVCGVLCFSGASKV